MAKNHHLVIEHLENIGAKVFEKFAPVITRFVDRRNGIYALYKGETLYYVGLASNLKGRLKEHLRDRHAQKWDRFSVYLTQSDRFLKDMESLILRISLPEGNRVKGKLPGSHDLKRSLQGEISTLQRMEMNGVLGKKAPTKSTRSTKLSGTRTIHLRREYKGRMYHAILRIDGTVSLRGKVYSSLSAAGVAVTKRGTNGRQFWRAKNSAGEWTLFYKLHEH